MDFFIYELRIIKKYDIPRELSYYGLKIPPQSYRYITQN